MKTFEERFTAYVDGQLADDELAQFEKELSGRPEDRLDADATRKLSRLLREHPTAPLLSNPEFFNLQIEQRIAADQPREQRSGWSWSLPRLIWAGAACLGMAGLMFKTLIPPTPVPMLDGDAPYFAQVVESWPSDPSISASTVYNARDNVTVLWLDGLDYIPASYELK